MGRVFVEKKDTVAENKGKSFYKRSPLVEKVKTVGLAAVTALALSLPATLSSCAPRYNSPTYQSTSTTTSTTPKVVERAKFGEYIVTFYRMGISPSYYKVISKLSDGEFMYDSKVGAARRGNLVYVVVKKDRYWDIGEYNLATNVNRGILVSPSTGTILGDRSKGWFYVKLDRAKGVLLDTKQRRLIFVDLSQGKQRSYYFLDDPW